jgi:hypothetical protein
VPGDNGDLALKEQIDTERGKGGDGLFHRVHEERSSPFWAFINTMWRWEVEQCKTVEPSNTGLIESCYMSELIFLVVIY